MTAIRSSPLRWTLISLFAALAVLVTLALMRGQRPVDQRVELPFDFRQTAGTSTDTLIGSLQEKIRENPKDFDAHIRLANAYLQKVRETGDLSLYTKAEDLLDEAQKLDDHSPESFATRGTLALARHDFQAALEYGTRALAWTLYKTGDYEEAQKYSSEALKLGTRDPLKLFHAGMIAMALGQRVHAREYLQRAVDLNPHFSLLYSDEAADSLKALNAKGED